MAKAFITFSDESNPNKLLIEVAEFATPLSLVTAPIVYNPPHPERKLTIPDLRPVMHTITFWESSDGVLKDMFIMSLDIDCSMLETQTIIYSYRVGRGDQEVGVWADPEPESNSMIDKRLIGVPGWIIERRGVGKLLNPEEVTTDTATGEWALTDTMMSYDEVFFAIVERTTAVQPGPQNSSGGSEEVVEVTGNITVDATNHLNKHLHGKVSSAATIDFPLFTTIPASKISVSNHESTAQLILAFQLGETAHLLGRALNKIYLGIGEEIEIIWRNNKPYVKRYEGDYRRIGEVVWSRIKDAEPNRLYMDGTTYFVSQQPRLFYEYIDRLPSGQVKTFAEWDTVQSINGIQETPYRGFYAYNAATSQFRMPDLRNRFIRALKDIGEIDPTRFGGEKAGALQMDAVGPLKDLLIELMPGEGGSSTNPIDAPLSGFSGMDRKKGAGNSQNFWVDNKFNGTENWIRISGGAEQTITRNIGFYPKVIC
jgi:hypothetical protein